VNKTLNRSGDGEQGKVNTLDFVSVVKVLEYINAI
jgi:hypothetical protein